VRALPAPPSAVRVVDASVFLVTASWTLTTFGGCLPLVCHVQLFGPNRQLVAEANVTVTGNATDAAAGPAAPARVRGADVWDGDSTGGGGGGRTVSSPSPAPSRAGGGAVRAVWEGPGGAGAGAGAGSGGWVAHVQAWPVTVTHDLPVPSTAPLARTDSVFVAVSVTSEVGTTVAVSSPWFKLATSDAGLSQGKAAAVVRGWWWM
jgi:hypothetical protein